MSSDILVGIDFGTTNTVISIFENNKSKVLVDGVFKTIPSKIAFHENKLYCGNYIPINATNIIHSFKITIGNDIVFTLGDRTFVHTDLLIIFFQHLHSIILKYHKIDNINIKAVITVPSNFNDMQREIIRGCFISVGINVIRIINEPSAAALAYGLNHSSNEMEKILVIDTGGGTMDMTILEKTDLFFEVVHSEGLNDLGGNNFSEIIVADMKKNKELVDINMNILWNQAQKIKEKLSYLDTYETKIANSSYVLSKTRFENLSNELIKKVESTLKNIIDTYKDLNYVILVGGTSRIPFLQRIIKNITKKTPWIHPNLESVVSEGAGFYCGIIENKYTKNEDVVLMDVLPLSLGVELVDGTFSIIIPKNTPLPVRRTQKYTTDSPADSSVEIKVYQGERVVASKNFLIGQFTFDKVSMGGVPVIEISFKIDLNSIINVIVSDKKSGVEKSILIKDIPTFDNIEVEKIIMMAEKSAQTDHDEMTQIQNIYMIRTHIENALANLSINDIIEQDEKENMINQFKTIEDTIETMNNLQLIDTLKELQDKYSILGSAQINDMEADASSSGDNIEKILLQERKDELKNRIMVALAKNPDWEEFLSPVLEQLEYSSITSEYVNQKLELLNELDTIECKDYKQEVNNLCMYLKTEIENGSIDLGEHTYGLIMLINDTMHCIVDNKEIDWEEKLNEINEKCNEIYNKKNLNK